MLSGKCERTTTTTTVKEGEGGKEERSDGDERRRERERGDRNKGPVGAENGSNENGRCEHLENSSTRGNGPNWTMNLL